MRANKGGGLLIGEGLLALFCLSFASCAAVDDSTPAVERNLVAIDAMNRLAACEPEPQGSFQPELKETILELEIDKGLIGMSAHVGFLDADPYPDILVSTSFSNSPDSSGNRHLTYLYGSRSGEFTVANGTVLGTLLEPYLVDLNADNVHDVVNFNFFALSGDDRRDRLVEIAGSRRTENNGFWVNIDGDHQVDFAEVVYDTDPGSADGRWLLQTYPDYFWNQAAAPLFVEPIDDVRLYFHDVSGDGSDDIVTLDRTYDGPVAMDSVRVLRNQSSEGRFSPWGTAMHFEHALAPPLVGDFDCDGQLEIVLLELGGNQTEVWKLGSDEWELMFSADGPSYFGQVGDLNGDGSHDLVIGGRGSLRAYLGDGSGGFGDPISIRSELLEIFAPSGVALGDVDRNGTDDIIAVLHAEERETGKAVLWTSAKP